jgi:hypothetical protein
MDARITTKRPEIGPAGFFPPGGKRLYRNLTRASLPEARVFR